MDPVDSNLARRRWVEGVRVLVVGGIPAGVLLVGVGSRLAMLVLRLTSPDRVKGRTSDDGFTIGQVTLSGTYNLLLLGAVVGIIGAAAYRAVAPRLIGPLWFRRLTTGVASAAVVGSMLVHADGIDFTVLKPAWLAIAVFVALPGLFGTFVGSIVDAVARPDSWTNTGRRRWVLPLVVLACFPPTILAVIFASAVFGIWVIITNAASIQRIRQARSYVFVIRSLWLLVAVAGLVALIGDTQAIADKLRT